ncbi:MAG: transposase [Deltaproteobacteria bacterium]|nr:transposase [Deltaproteobacteria bacterium]
MAIRSKIYQSEYPYHLFNRTNNKEFLFDLPQVFPMFRDTLRYIALQLHVDLHHFILLNNHFHLIASFAENNLAEFMQRFQSCFSKTFNTLSNRINHIFGGRYGATVVMSQEYLCHLIRYVYQNATHANKWTLQSNYPYSSLPLYSDGQWKTFGLKLDPYIRGLPSEEQISQILQLSQVGLQENELDHLERKLKKRFI